MKHYSANRAKSVEICALLSMLFFVSTCKGQTPPSDTKNQVQAPPSIVTPSKGCITFGYDHEAWKTKQVNQSIYSFYGEDGRKVKTFLRNSPPERSPYATLPFKYVVKGNPNITSPLSLDSSSVVGYFDLSRYSFKARKKIFGKHNIVLQDSVIKSAERIYHYAPPNVDYCSKKYLVITSSFIIKGVKNATLLKADHISVYDFNYIVIKDIIINNKMFSAKSISDDGNYLLLAQEMVYGVEDESGVEDPLWEDTPATDYSLPLLLLDLKSEDQTLLTINGRNQPVTAMFYWKDCFHVIYGGETHAIIDIKNKRHYTKYYKQNEVPHTPLETAIKEEKIDITKYDIQNFRQ